MYQTVRDLIRLGALTWDVLYADALGRVVSESFNENFRQGRISGRDASLVHQYLRRYHLDACQALDANASAGKKLTEFMLRYRRLGMVTTLPEHLYYPFRHFRLGPEWAEFPFEAYEKICFRLRPTYVYDAVCLLNGSDMGWYPLAIEPPTDPDPPGQELQEWSHTLLKFLFEGAQTICTVPPTPVQSYRWGAPNVFLFLIGDAELLYDICTGWHPERVSPDEEMDEVAERLTATKTRQWTLTQVNSIGTPTREYQDPPNEQ